MGRALNTTDDRYGAGAASVAVSWLCFGVLLAVVALGTVGGAESLAAALGAGANAWAASWLARRTRR
ncbi:MAG: hypothetical protein ACTS22_08300 [Phycisphaerales bacterium]